jgi:hypothetical protein
MSLMDLLLNAPSAQDRYQQVAGMSGGPSPGGLGGGYGPLPAGGGGGVEGMARDFFLSHGYSPQDFRKVDSIIGRESSWDPHAVNDSSGAAGVAQNINGFSQGYSRNDPLEQIHWLFNYLGNHNYEGYGTGIDAALAHKNDTGWY